jgi:hypothetical protein
MNLKIKFYARTSSEPIIIDVPNDVVEIQIPNNGQNPGLKINVNSDMVIIDRLSDGNRVGAYDFTELLSEAGMLSPPRLMAQFRPQRWVGDVCEDVEGGYEFDATSQFLSLPSEKIRSFKENDYDSDNLVGDRVLDGPFEVDTDIDGWLEGMGFPPRHQLTDKQIGELRLKYDLMDDDQD